MSLVDGPPHITATGGRTALAETKCRKQTRTGLANTGGGASWGGWRPNGLLSDQPAREPSPQSTDAPIDRWHSDCWTAGEEFNSRRENWLAG